MSDTNLSALSSLGTVQQVAANNVANVNTDGFKASSVVLQSGPEDQGVRVGAIHQSSTPGAWSMVSRPPIPTSVAKWLA